LYMKKIFYLLYILPAFVVNAEDEYYEQADQRLEYYKAYISCNSPGSRDNN